MTDPTSARAESGTIRGGALRVLPLAAAVIVFGVSFGVLATSSGVFSPLGAVVFSATTFAGSAQFAAASVLAAGGQPFAAIAAAILLNLRYGPIGASIAPYLRASVARRFAAAQLVVDESWAVASRGGGRFEVRTLIGAGIVLWIAWVLGTLIGSVGGERLGDPASLGMDAAFPALFLALLATQLRGGRALAAAVLGATIALAILPLTAPGVPVLAAAAAALIGWSRR